MKNIVLFASGNGSNAEQHYGIISRNRVKRKNSRLFSLIRQMPKSIDRAKKSYRYLSVVIYSTKPQLSNDTVLYLKSYKQLQPDLIVLAGFLLKFPESILKEYPKVINIHPALLPKYGGKGMYGMNVHQAVLDNNEIETGITIHYVNEHYDEGEFIFQKSVNIEDCKTAEEIAYKIHELEHQYFPTVISDVLNSKF
jgi:phosphoribosylglycinamide formyltransferase 1